MYEKMFQYVQAYLADAGCDNASKSGKHYPFRKRSEHILRVYLWAKRLSESDASINREALLTAAIFHDIGYAQLPSGMEHAQNSAMLCQQYLSENSYDPSFIELVTFLVKNHSHKELLTAAGTPLELIYLMEADLLDETGALAIVWDCMVEGAQETQSFEKTYHHMLSYSMKELRTNPMVTDKAKAFWEEKQRLGNTFMAQLSFDLGLKETGL